MIINKNIMKIEKYDASTQVMGKVTRDNFETRLLATSYSSDNEYTLIEFTKKLVNGTWTGGYVQGLGWVGANDFVRSSEESEYGSDMITFVHGSSINGDDFENSIASMFSFMNPPYTSEDGEDDNNSNSGNNVNNPSDSKMEYSSKDFTWQDFRITVKTCIMFDCAMFYFYLSYSGIAHNGLKIDCVATNQETDEQTKNLFSENRTGYVNYNQQAIGNCALHMNNGRLDSSINLVIYDNINCKNYYCVI